MEIDQKHSSKQIQNDLDYLKEWISQQAHLIARTGVLFYAYSNYFTFSDDNWLKIFLRGCKYSLEKTKEKINSYYSLRHILPEFFENRDPLRPEIQQILSLGLFVPLPRTAKNETKFFFHRCKCIDVLDISIIDLTKVSLMMMDIVFIEDVSNDSAKIEFLLDADTLNMDHVKKMNPMLVKKFLTYLHNSYPLRPQGFHFINSPSILEGALSIFTPLISKKLSDRMHIYSKYNSNEIHEHIPLDVLPVDVGGDGKSLDELIVEWKSKVESYRDWFIEDAKYGINTNLISDRADCFGIQGSFRQLSID